MTQIATTSGVPVNANCYTCKYRGAIPGNTHVTCSHPQADFIGVLMGQNPLKIVANVHGVKSGWFHWPLDFDPVWLVSCDGYEAK